MTWLLDYVPAWAFALAGAGLLLVIWRVFGLKATLAAAAALLGAGIYKSGRKAGADDALSGVKRANEKAVKDHEEIEAETDRMSDAELDAANRPWVRNRK